MESYITIEELQPLQRIKINSMNYVADGNGMIFLSESMVLAKNEKPIKKYEAFLEKELNDRDRMGILYEFGRSSAIILNSVAGRLDGQRGLAKMILQAGERFGVLSRGHNYTWKVNDKLAKDSMLVIAKQIDERINMLQPELTSDEHRDKVLSNYERPTEKILDDTFDNTPYTEEQMSQPGPIKLVKKGSVPTPSQKPDLPKPLRKTLKRI